MIHGYHNRIVEIDLSSRKIHERSFSKDFWQDYIGGTGLGAKLLYEELPSGTGPLGPSNVLM
ncbi:MAG: aldehyde ferredoxin oxidoreductase N-terminal domain-containing protein, partial [Spirochaetota bacterium]